MNDFLKDYLQKNDVERENIKENATEYEQIKRGFSENIEDIIRSGEAISYNYTDLNEKLYVILTYICRLEVFHDNYKYTVERFFKSLPYGYVEGMMGRCEIFIRLLSDKFDAFYDTYACLDDGSLKEFFDDLGEFQVLIELAVKYGIDFFYVKYRDVFLETIKAAILAYMENVDADVYYGDYDIGDLLSQNMIYNGCYEEVDTESVVDIVCDWIKEDVEQEVYGMIEKLPQDLLNNIEISKKDINIGRSDVEGYIANYLEPSESEYEPHEMDYGIGGMDVLDYIFK